MGIFNYFKEFQYGFIPVICPVCGHDKISKRGKTENGKQRYFCQHPECSVRTFILDYDYNGYLPEVKNKIIDMAINGSGIRDTARVLAVSPTTMINELKKSCLESVNRAVLNSLNPHKVVVDIQKVEDPEAELDEMWSYVRSKEHQRWVWHAIDHNTGKIMAYTLGDHKDEVFLMLKEPLEPFGITRFYTDDWGAYERHLPPEQHTISKANTQ